MKDTFNKKRLLYNNSEDLYFLTYNIILILHYLECVNPNNTFKDYRKLIFLIPIISRDNNTTLLCDYYKKKLQPNNNISKEIGRIYYDSIEDVALIRYLLIILEKKDIIALVAEDNKTNLYLKQSTILKEFVNNEKFTLEKERINKIKNNVTRIKSLKYMTFVNNFFKSNGVAIWEN